MNDSMAACVVRYFLAKAEDADIKPVLDFALQLSQTHLDIIKKVFNQNHVAIPIAFTDNDVNVKASRLFSDAFALRYLQQWTIVGLAAFGVALGLAARTDIRKFYSECLRSTVDLHKLKKFYYRRGFISVHLI